MTPERIKTLLDPLNDDPFFWMTDGYCDPHASNLLNWNKEIGSVTSLSSAYDDLDTMHSSDNTACLLSDTITYHSVYGMHTKIIPSYS